MAHTSTTSRLRKTAAAKASAVQASAAAVSAVHAVAAKTSSAKASSTRTSSTKAPSAKRSGGKGREAKASAVGTSAANSIAKKGAAGRGAAAKASGLDSGKSKRAAKATGSGGDAGRAVSKPRAKAVAKSKDVSHAKAGSKEPAARSSEVRKGKGRAGAGGHETPKRGGRPRRSQADAQAKRQKILSAALQVFSQYGFEAARLDEVARKAGVAKGTLYLYYPNKQAMFEALVRSSVSPLIEEMSGVVREQSIAPEDLLKRIFDLFRREVLETDRKLILRLIIAEGPRFPEIAHFYHREVVSRIMTTLEEIAQTLRVEGLIASDALVRYPQLIAAPLALSVIWDGLFARIDPLDVEALLSAHAELLMTARTRRTQR
ncbi:MAG TPA: TetR family transcriptional regulator [Hyphomicrobiaceae bacterium]|nr:TetR family transcriptional regulator [Hyphomicrobiaceae bacterium]